MNSNDDLRRPHQCRCTAEPHSMSGKTNLNVASPTSTVKGVGHKEGSTGYYANLNTRPSVLIAGLQSGVVNLR